MLHNESITSVQTTQIKIGRTTGWITFSSDVGGAVIVVLYEKEIWRTGNG